MDPNAYADAARWVCLPEREDACSRARTIVEIRADASSVPVTDAAAAASSPVDCFYVYPTVSMSIVPGNADNFTGNREEIDAVAAVQAASFGGACRVFAPLYRQGTIATYLMPETVRQGYVGVALADVTAAFDHYLAHRNEGRKVVLIGHSQGAEMITRLMQARFDHSAALRERLLLAIIAGAPVQVPVDRTTGGTFNTIPLCSRPGETGCYVTFKSYIAGTSPSADGRLRTPPGQEAACVNPATLDDPALSAADRRSEWKVLQGTLLPPPAWSFRAVRGDASSRTFTQLGGAYSAACVTDPAERLSYLAIREEMAPDDPRRGLVSFETGSLRRGLGLHVLDLQFPLEELVALVRTRVRPR